MSEACISRCPANQCFLRPLIESGVQLGKTMDTISHPDDDSHLVALRALHTSLIKSCRNYSEEVVLASLERQANDVAEA